MADFSQDKFHQCKDRRRNSLERALCCIDRIDMVQRKRWSGAPIEMIHSYLKEDLLNGFLSIFIKKMKDTGKVGKSLTGDLAGDGQSQLPQNFKFMLLCDTENNNERKKKMG